ncbi:DUF4625 domain-containing protein [Parabacteroides sp. PF5-9]|uniref:DUF4625 domain-containing protein n=1 Tax=Parabacteroides sp. PF5-9 TaxID=1742404 RepID=UPI002474B5BE|nr:DUF4625 domain-containing protein [Parabacteroides sp. PF5-9]MDH6359056.1 hypothetical protein [Parabacteroides sp. PF5-9]
MKTRTFFTLLSLVVAFVSFNSCDDDGDTSKPVIQIIQPEDGAELLIGSTLLVKLELSDNEALRSYRINIHDAAGHSHGEGIHEEEEEDDDEHDEHAEEDHKENPFSFDKSWDVSGDKATVEQQITIPKDVSPGKYHMIVFCSDISGNEGQAVRSMTFLIQYE